MIIGLPTLRLRGDYIAIVTLALRRDRPASPSTATPAILGHNLTNGRQGISPVDPVSRSRSASTVHLGVNLSALLLDRAGPRADRAVRQLPPARLAARPRVDRAARGRGRGRLDGRPARHAPSCWPTRPARRSAASRARSSASYLEHDQRRPVRVLLLDLHPRDGHPRRPRAIWGVVVGAVALSTHQPLPDPATSSTRAARKLGAGLPTSTAISFGIFGFLLVIMMVLRPEGLIPEPTTRARARARPTRRSRSATDVGDDASVTTVHDARPAP